MPNHVNLRMSALPQTVSREQIHQAADVLGIPGEQISSMTVTGSGVEVEAFLYVPVEGCASARPLAGGDLGFPKTNVFIPVDTDAKFSIDENANTHTITN